jgi:hypothetical protein
VNRVHSLLFTSHFRVTHLRRVKFVHRHHTGVYAFQKQERLLTNVQLFEDRFVPLGIFIFQKIQQTPTLANHFQKSATGMMVLCVTLEMLGERIDSLGEDGYLNFGRARIRRMSLVRADDFRLALFRQHETLFSFYLFLEPRII